jgi:hypothetical protein
MMDLRDKTHRQFCARTWQVASMLALGDALAAALESCGGGRVVNGPAVSLLPQFRAPFADDVLKVTA